VKKLRIGLVDLDTSHPGSFLPVIRNMGHEVTAVFDGGAVYPEGYAESFASQHQIPFAAKSLDEMIDRVDVAIIHSCNWDVHVERARPFVEAGKAVYIDKPLAGNRKDLRQMIEWSRRGVRITGGSSLRCCYEVQEWRNKGIPQEDWVYAMVGCGVDEFNYAIHAYAMLQGLLGPGIESARLIGVSGQRQIELAWKDGRRGMVSIGKTAGYLPFYANIVTQKQVDFIKVDNKGLYKALLENVLPYLAGEAPEPLPFEQLAEAELSAIAAKLSAEQGGQPVALADVPEDYAGYNGHEFAIEYKALKFPSKP